MNFEEENKLIYEHPQTKAKFYKNSGTESTTSYAKSKGLPSVSCLLVEEADGNTTYVLLEESEGQSVPFYESDKLEDLGVRIDLLSVTLKMNK